MGAGQRTRGRGPRTRSNSWSREEGVTKIVRKIVAQGARLVRVRRRIDDFGVAGLTVIFEQDACAAIVHHQDRRQHQRRNFGDRPFDGLDFKASLFGSPFEQARGQSCVCDRKAGEQRLPTHCTAVVGGEVQERIGQRIGLGALRQRAQPGFTGLSRACKFFSDAHSWFLSRIRAIVARIGFACTQWCSAAIHGQCQTQ